MPALDFKGGKIAYSVSGNGPAVVFLHGFLENKEIWNDYGSALSSKYKVICPDLPGHGQSSNFGYSHSMEMMAEAVKSLLKELKIRKFYLIGHSMGGYVALALAEKYPDNIKGICLFHSTADNDDEDRKKERQKVIKVIQKKKDTFINESIPNLFNTKHKPYKRPIAKIIKMAKSMTVQGIIASLEGMRIRANREIVLKFAPYPVLYIIGRKDAILPWEKLIAESKLSDNAQYEVFDTCGHMGFIEEKEACFKALSHFLRRKL